MCVLWGVLLLGAALLWFTWDMPRPEGALAATRRPSVTLQAGDGRVIATSGDLYGESLRLRDLPPHVPAAFIAIEDRRFREHFGIDPIGLARALYANYAAGRVVQGGSTLTQQLAKNLFLTPERSFRRKVQEAILALWLERRFSKDELLEIYLNRVYLGAGAYGVDAAARLYFGVSARRLTVAQAAILAGLPKAPSRLNPRVNPSAAVARATEVLEAMAETGALPVAAAMREAERLAIPPAPSRDAGWFADWAQEELRNSSDPRLRREDLVLRTTLDARLQAAVEARLEALLAGPGARAGVFQGAVVALDAQTGAVRAMVGGRDYRQSPFNRATQARRQPGSAFKPFVFLAALEHGARPEDMVADGPLTLGGWSPGNGAWRARGEITVEEALAHSVNTAAVRVLQRAGGPRAAIEAAGRLGLAGPFPRDASIALGTGEVSLLELTAAYAAFANGGWRVTPHGLRETVPAPGTRGRGEALPVPPTRRVVEPERAEAMRGMLEAAVARGTGRAAGPGAAGKTGTTQDNRDAWFIGFTPPLPGAPAGLVMGIWLGNDDATPMDGVAGGGLPARLFRLILEGWPAARSLTGEPRAGGG
ncbi:MAG TPA: PBP1A family penicillin-binding protein [Acetobacteraceae bacterium]|nr:PBP1A family penicillin-binding protein [Acetobacteraceae bacterium]